MQFGIIFQHRQIHVSANKVPATYRTVELPAGTLPLLLAEKALNSAPPIVP